MGALCTACQKLTRFVFQSERNTMFLLCLAGMITLRNQTKNLAEAYFLWCSYNKSRLGVVHELMKKSRAMFKYAQNQVLKNEKT